MLLMCMDIPQAAQHLLPPLCYAVSPIPPEPASTVSRAFFSFLVFIIFLVCLIHSKANSGEIRFGVRLYLSS